MMMRKKNLAAIIIWFICAVLLAGCGSLRSSGSDTADKADKAEKNTEAINKADKKDEDESVPKPAGDDKETEETDHDFDTAFKQGRVYNNGNYFVRIKDKVYFRIITPESMEKGAIFGEFLNTELSTLNCPLISYDINTGKWEQIGTVAGTGKLYACPEGFYIGETDPESFGSNCTNLYDPATDERSFYCAGLPLGVSESGKILAVDVLDGQDLYTVLYKGGVEITRLGGTDKYYEYVGFAGETLIVMLRNEKDEYILYSVDDKGNAAMLGMIGNSDNGYAEPKQLLTIDDHVYVCIGYYEGTGHFLSGWEVVKAKPGTEGSLETAIDGADVPSVYDGEGPDPDVPVIYINETGVIDYIDHKAYEAFMGDGEQENDLLYYNEIYDECLLAEDFADRGSPENCSIIQDIESIAETAFVIYANAEADSEYDIGWRTGYRMTGWHICAIPFESGNIIRFFDEGAVSKAEPSDKADPLEGLVSEDILEQFRKSNAIKDPGSIEDEAGALGRWVYRSIGKIPEEIRNKGERIGQRYEFWFGTDIANNFNDNFPRIYATYYSLKDHYISDGKRSRDFYEAVMEENGFLGNDDPQNIENMYNDMKEFITDCNNIIRNKRN